MNNPLELTPEEARFLDHVIHEGCSHSPPIAHKMLVDLGVYSSGWTVAALETIRIWELGQLVTERSLIRQSRYLGRPRKKSLPGRRKCEQLWMRPEPRNAKLESEAEHRKSGT